MLVRGFGGITRMVGKKHSLGDERIIAEIQAVVESRIKALCAKDGTSLEDTEKEVSEARADIIELFEENKPKWQALIQINKLLSSKYGSEFAKSVWEIKPDTIAEKQITDLLIHLSKILQEETPKESEIRSLLEPFIVRNSEHINQRLKKAEQQLEKAISEREEESRQKLKEAERKREAEELLQRKIQEGEALRQALQAQKNVQPTQVDQPKTSFPKDETVNSGPANKTLLLSTTLDKRRSSTGENELSNPEKKQKKISDSFSK